MKKTAPSTGLPPQRTVARSSCSSRAAPATRRSCRQVSFSAPGSEARIPDWRKLAPSLAVREEPPPRLLLIARDFDRATRIAAREAAGAAIVLARWRFAGTTGEVDLQRIEPEPRVGRDLPAPAPKASSSFRTGLRDADFVN